MKELNEDKMETIVIDLNSPNKLDEGFLESLGFQLGYVMKRMMAGAGIEGSVTGTKSQVNSFANALKNEKRYLESLDRHGLGDTNTFKSKWALDQAVKNFEKETGLKWPFK